MQAAPRIGNTGRVTTHQIRFEGPMGVAISVATALADADGVELTSSKSPTPLGDDRFALELVVEGTRPDVAAAIVVIDDGLPAGATITFVS